MKHLFTILIIVILNTMNLYSIKLNPERLITDYNGIAFNGNTVLCYGNHGIIALSNDEGNTWKQVNIGDKHNIQKIVNDGSVFYGVSEFAVFKSTNNGLNWMIAELYEEPTIISISNSSDNLFIASRAEILSINSSLEIIGRISTNITVTSENLICTTEGNYHYLLLNNNLLPECVLFIISIDGTVREARKIKFNELCEGCKEIEKIVIDDDYLYAYISGTISGIAKRNLGKYNIKSKEWQILNNEPLAPFVYLMENSQIFYLIADPPVFPDTKGANPVFFKLNPDGTSSQISEGIIDERVIGKRLGKGDSFNFTDIKHISPTNIIAVGDNKLIVRSTDVGRTWEVISFFKMGVSYDYSNHLFSNRFSIQASGSNRMYMLDNAAISTLLNSSDDGATWLPPRKTADYVKSFTPSFHFNNYGKGIMLSIMPQQSGYKNISNDYGNSFVSSKSYELAREFSDFRPNYKIVDLDGEYIAGFWVRDDKNIYSQFYILNSNYDVIDSSRIDSVETKDIIRISSSQLLTLGMQRKTYSRTLPSGTDIYRNVEYILLSSTDNGRTWQESEVILPFSPPQDRLNTGAFFDPVSSLFQYDNKILITRFYGDLVNAMYYDDEDLIYVYDTHTRKFSSFRLPVTLHRNLEINAYSSHFFTLKDKLFVIGSDFNLYFTEDSDLVNANWEKIEMSDFLYDWIPQTAFSTSLGRSSILSAWSDNENAYLAVGRTVSLVQNQTVLNLNFDVNLVRLFKDETTSVIETQSEYETEKVMFYSTNPYPIPTSGFVQSKLYWNSAYNISNATIFVYNSMGVKVEFNPPQIEPINLYSGNVTWDCNGVPPGVYFIVITLAEQRHTIPIVLSK